MTPSSSSARPPRWQSGRSARGEVRLGGLVEDGSVTKNGTTTIFAITDGNATVKVAYTGILPDLFREGQGVVTEGALQPDGMFVADTVLAKHDENYMPREVADALKEQGLWQHVEDGEGPVSDRPSGS